MDMFRLFTLVPARRESLQDISVLFYNYLLLYLKDWAVKI